jgi:hypothetical protein
VVLCFAPPGTDPATVPAALQAEIYALWNRSAAAAAGEEWAQDELNATRGESHSEAESEDETLDDEGGAAALGSDGEGEGAAEGDVYDDEGSEEDEDEDEESEDEPGGRVGNAFAGLAMDEECE